MGNANDCWFFERFSRDLQTAVSGSTWPEFGKQRVDYKDLAVAISLLPSLNHLLCTMKVLLIISLLLVPLVLCGMSAERSSSFIFYVWWAYYLDCLHWSDVQCRSACPPGMICVLNQIQCIRAPCDPVEVCVPGKRLISLNVSLTWRNHVPFCKVCPTGIRFHAKHSATKMIKVTFSYLISSM